MALGGMTKILIVATLSIMSCAAKVDHQKAEFVFVHGLSHGAWCWYKVLAILERKGYKATAIDLLSNGRDQTDPDTVTSLSQYAQPLTEYLTNVSRRVVLVGHSMGGASISYAAETYPEKISKLVYVAGLLQQNNESVADTFAPGTQELNVQRGVTQFSPPSGTHTSVRINPDFKLASQYLYNESPVEDAYLAASLLKWSPYSPLSEKVMLSPERYGSIARYYVVTGRDALLDVETYQEARLAVVPMDGVFHLKNSDHSPFFCEPIELANILVEILSL